MKEVNTSAITCKNCGNIFNGNYCSICGQKVINQRFKLKDALNDALASTFALDKGFFYTLSQLFIDPGKTIKEYLSGKTKVYFNPLKFLIIIAGLSAFISIITKSFDRNLSITTTFSPEDFNNTQIKTIAFFKNYVNIIMLILVPFYTFAYKLFFLRKKLNYTEHLIINCYAFGTGTLLIIIPSIVFLFIHDLSVLETITGFVIQISVYSYFYYKLNNKNLYQTIFYSIVAMFIGLVLTLMVFATLSLLTILVLSNLGVI